MNIVCITALSTLLLIGPAIPLATAEPSSAVNYLMDDKVSMFDYGLDKTEAQIKESLREKKWSPMLSYDWKKNRIIIDVHQFPLTTNKDLAEARLLVDEIFWLIRYEFGLDLTGKLHPSFKCSSLYLNFTHRGFSKRDEPTNLGSDLDTITEIRAIVVIEKGKSIKCTGPLVSDEIFCTDPE